MDTSISNGSSNNNFAMVLGVLAGAVLLALLSPLALNAVAPLACWKAMINLYFSGARYASLGAFAASLFGVDVGGVACVLLMFACPVHLLVRYAFKLLGKDVDDTALFSASITK